MMIPQSFKLSGKRWRVARYGLRSGYRGMCYPQHRIVALYEQPRSLAKHVAQTFWHEMTHAILFDMDHRLAKDEGFVDAFSKRLAEAVRTAEL